MARWRRRTTAPAKAGDDVRGEVPADRAGSASDEGVDARPDQGTDQGTEADSDTSPTRTLVDVVADDREAPVKAPEDAPEDAGTDAGAADAPPSRRTLATTTPVCLARAAHPVHAVLTAVAMAIAAALSGRPGREVLLVAVTVLVGQTLLGWHNDLVDARRDRRHAPDDAAKARRKPIAAGLLDAGTTWYAWVVALLVLVPLSLSSGPTAGLFYLGSVVVGVLSNVVLRRGLLSWVLWAASFALLVPYLSYGGWGSGSHGSAPQVGIVVVTALLGVGVHVLGSIWGLLADDADGWRSLPLRLGRRLGATRLFVVATTWSVVMVVVLLVLGETTGLHS